MADKKKTVAKGNAPLSAHQERIYGAFFEAVETVGKRLERTEAERHALEKRLDSLESRANRDETTGEFYIPVRVQETSSTMPKAAMAASAFSIMVAVSALFLALTNEPTLSNEQLAALSQASRTPQNVFERERPSLEINRQNRDVQPAANGTDAGRPDESLLSTPDTRASSEVAPNPMIASILDSLEEGREDAQNSIEANDQSYDRPNVDAIEEATALADNQEIVEEVELPTTDAQTETSSDASEAPAQEPETPVVAKVEPESKGEQAPAGAPANTAAPQQPRQEAVAKAAPPTMRPVSKPDISRDATLSGNTLALQDRAFEGVPEAQHDLATVYASGALGQPDYQRALYWFEHAAEAGIANAHYNLGVMAQQGLGRDQDMTQALSWYSNAAELGHPEALYNLAIAYTEGIGTPADIDRGVSYFERAARAGVAQAAYNLGILYESSFLGGIDKASAADWYKSAAEMGHEPAQAAYARVTGKTLIVETTEESRISGIQTAAGSYDPEGSLVSNIQNLLIGANYLPEPADGIIGAQTTDAIKSYEKDFNLPVTGQATPEIHEHMKINLQ